MASSKSNEISNSQPQGESAVAPRKSPPPEKPGQRKNRTLVIISFWVIAVTLGIPIWILTTSIHREQLPLQEMLSWADGKACKPSVPLQIAIEAGPIPSVEAAHLVKLTQHALDDQNEFSAHHLRLRHTENNENRADGGSSKKGAGSSTGTSRRRSTEVDALTVHLINDKTLSTPQDFLRPHTTDLEIRYPPGLVPSVSSSSSALSNFIAASLEALFQEEKAIIEATLTSAHASGSAGAGSSPHSVAREARTRLGRLSDTSMVDQMSARKTRSLKYATTYHLTFSLFTPGSLPANWEIEAGIDEYLGPLLKSLSTVSTFKVDTQIQLHAKFTPSTPTPEYDTESQAWTMKQEDLSNFINAAEWPLSPSIGDGPTLNFVLYVPTPAQTPLIVKESHSNNWLIPQWGGIFIANNWNATGTSRHMSKEQIQPALLTFSHHLLSLLGAPRSPASLPVRLQTLVRVQALSLLLSASSTLGSLARLVVALPSIAIPETVSSAVDRTLLHLGQTCEALKSGRYEAALEHARTAEAQAEKGFFEKSMVGQVYFPDEHKVAVYLPLLGPIGVPLIMSAVKELKRFIASRRAKGTSAMAK